MAKYNPLIDVELGEQQRSTSHTSVRQAFDFPDELMLQQEQSPAYKALHEAGLIVHTYRLKSSSDLDVVPGNASVNSNFLRRTVAYSAGLVVGGFIYDAFMHQFTVKQGHVRPALHSDGRYYFYGPGVHRISRIFITASDDISLTQRLYNDEVRRKKGPQSDDSWTPFRRRAATAAFLLDFAVDVGVKLPPLPDTYANMLAEFSARAAGWEKQQQDLLTSRTETKFHTETKFFSAITSASLSWLGGPCMSRGKEWN